MKSDIITTDSLTQALKVIFLCNFQQLISKDQRTDRAAVWRPQKCISKILKIVDERH